MRILFLTHYFPPEVNAPATRTYEHCREWVDKDNAEVTVITNFPNHPEGKIFDGYKNKLIQKEKIDGINVIRLWTFLAANQGFLLRTLNYIIYMILAVIYAVFSRIKFDIVISTTPQFFCGLAGKYVAKLRRKPFILELRDLWPESIVSVGAITNQKIINRLEKIELNLYKSADHIISVTRSFKRNLVSRGIDETKISLIFNSILIDNLNGKAEIKDKELSEYLKSGFKVGYIGTVGMAHSIKTLVEAAENSESGVKYVVVGSGAEKENIKRMIDEKNLDNIKLFPLQPKGDIPAIIENLDVFLVHLKKNDLFKTVIPSKIFEGMALKKPILIGVDGESREIIEKGSCGLYFEPENAVELVEKVNLLKNNEELRKEYGENGYKHVLEKFNRKKSAQDFYEIISEVVS